MRISLIGCLSIDVQAIDKNPIKVIFIQTDSFSPNCLGLVKMCLILGSGRCVRGVWELSDRLFIVSSY